MTLQVAELIPDDGFLRHYVDYATRQVIGTPEIHLFCGLAVISTCVAPAVKFYLGEQYRHPHVWSVIISRAGAGKSAPLGVARRIISEVVQDGVLPSDFSREAFFERVAANPYGFLEVDEFGGFLARANRDYMSGLKQDLSKMYDSPAVYSRALKSGSCTVHNPAFTILGAAPVDDLTRNASSIDFRQGFLTRFLFITQQTDTSYVGAVEPDHGARQHLIEYTREMIRLRQDVTTWPATPKWLRQWEAYDRRYRTQAERVLPELSGFYGRAGLHIWKLAILLSVSKHDHPKPDAEELARAHQIVAGVLESLTDLISNEVGLGPDERRRKDAFEKGRDLSRQHHHQWVNWSAWLRACRWAEARRLREWADGWHEAGLIELKNGPSRPNEGRPALQFRFPRIGHITPEEIAQPTQTTHGKNRERSPSFPERSPQPTTESEPNP